MVRLSLRLKLVLAALLPAVLVFALALGLVLALTRQVLEGELGERLVGVAQATASTLPVDRLPLLAPGDEGTRTYAHVRERLTAMREATSAARILVVDLQGRLLCGSDDAGRVGEPVAALERDRLELARVSQGTPQASSVLFRGADGSPFKSGYAPVRDGTGAVIAVVAVDGSAPFFAPLAALRAKLLGLGLVAALLLAAVAFALGQAFVSPIFALVAAARRIGQGDLESPVRLARGDELGLLASDLEQMRRALLARDRHLQMMLAGVAHEVRNPLGGMELYAGMLAEDLADRPAQLDHVAKIRRELEYLRGLVDDFLDFARTRPLTREPVDLSALVDEVAELSRAMLVPRKVALRVNRPLAMAPAAIDASALRRVLLNVLKNAGEASPSGATVEVTLTQGSQGITLAVQDEGPGIPLEQRERIFEPFFTTKEKGTGLGLAFARKLVEQHGGTLTVADGSPKGALLVIALPA
jgi:signal transduction histidine kinase